ncbi:MAG: hypothetical protein ACJ8LG_21670 [Massilia sp.]
MKLSSAFPMKAALAVAVLAAVGVFFYVRNKGVTGVAADVTGAVLDTGAGVAIGIGDAIGIPRTNESECEKAIREGRTLDASFACPAGTFIKSLLPW